MPLMRVSVVLEPGGKGRTDRDCMGRVLVRCVAGRMRDVNQMLGVGWW